jgi:hypothetical protein
MFMVIRIPALVISFSIKRRNHRFAAPHLVAELDPDFGA